MKFELNPVAKVLATFLIFTNLILSSFAVADEDEIKKIKSQFDEKPYATEAFEYPRCEEVLDRKREENVLILEAVLGKLKEAGAEESQALTLFKEMEHFYPSRTILKDKTYPTVIKQGEEERIAAFFDGATDIYRLQLTEDGTNGKAATVPLSQVNEGDLVLSTTSLVVSDSRYHKDCWAKVQKKFTGKVSKGEKMGHILYRSPKKERLRLKSTVFPSLYCRAEGQNEWKHLLAGDPELSPNSQLFTLNGATGGFCHFSELWEETATEEFEAFNLGVPETGAYYVGSLGAEILIHN